MKNTVGLFDLDSLKTTPHTFPNLALMKISSYYKQLGHTIYLNPKYPTELGIASAVFPWNKQPPNLFTHVGGSGYSIESSLEEISSSIYHSLPDYSLYGIEYGMGFLTRGCVRKCEFCIVHRKEGKIHLDTPIKEIINPLSKRVILMDNNFLGIPDREDLLQELIDRELEVDFNQGLDIRLLNFSTASLLKELKSPVLRFAFDSLSYRKDFERGVEIFNTLRMKGRISLYLLIGFNSSYEDDLERISLVNKYRINTFFMLYRNLTDGSIPVPSLGHKENIKLFEQEIATTRSPTGNKQKILKWFYS